MANRENHGAKGSMYLKRNYEESSSGHTEDYDDLKLDASADGASVILTETTGSKNFIRHNDGSYSESNYEISVTDLARLIKANGRRI